MEITKVLVTPEMAQEWLDHQAVNRRVRTRIVKQMARDMAAGIWRSSTNEALAFNPERKMIDGQHRCLAVILYGKPVEMAVVYGVDHHIGTPQIRTPHDVAKIEYGEDLNERALSIANELNTSHYGLTNHEKLMLYTTHRQAVDFAVSISGHDRGVGRVAVAAVYARAFYHEDRQRIMEFADVLRSGITTKEEDIAALRLREQLLRSNLGAGYALRRDTRFRTESALRAFCQRRPLGVVKPAARELYPLPGEETPHA